MPVPSWTAAEHRKVTDVVGRVQPRAPRVFDRMQAVGKNFFFKSRRRHTILQGDWSSDVCSSDRAARFPFFDPPMITLKAPSFSRVFAVAFLGIAVAGLASLIATWQSARRTQAAMVVLTQRLEDLDRASTAPAFRSELAAMRELTVEVGDDAIQTAVQTSVIFVILLVVLGVALWYNRGRLAAPFAHGGGARERAAAGKYDERPDEKQPEEFGMIARGLTRMAAALAWRERMQDHPARLLTASAAAIRFRPRAIIPN